MKLRSMHAGRQAFTLVELLVVIAIIGLLSTVAVVATNSAGANSRNQKRKADLVQISKALELYYSDNGAYPSTGGAVWFGICSTFGSHASTGAGAWIPNLAPTYMATLPREPFANGNPNSPNASGCSPAANDCYIYQSNGTDYKVMAHCGPEGAAVTASDPYYDRAGRYWVYQISTPGGLLW